MLVFVLPASAQTVDHSDWNGLRQRHPRAVKCLDYDWTLNEQAH